MPYQVMTYKPYKYHCVQRRVWSQDEWAISFEESVVRTINCHEDDVKQIVFLMNTAYMLGHGKGWIDCEFDAIKVG